MRNCFSIVFALLFLSSSALFSQELPEPYNTAQILPFNDHGWFLNAAPLESLIKQKNVKTIVEVGSWLGTSTRHMAALLPEGGKLYAVDHWLGSEEHQPGQWAYHPALDTLYEQFLSNVIQAGLAFKIVPLRMSSLDAAVYLGSLQPSISPDLIYLDASHDTESVYADMNAWYPFVEKQGILCGDDWIFGTVQVAVKRFAQERNLRVEAGGNFWCLFK